MQNESMSAAPSDPAAVPPPRDAEQAARAFARPQREVEAGDERLAYWRFGRGPDVVLVHGWPLHAATFRNVVPTLARELTLHVFDLPGAGWSRARGPVGLAEHAATLRRAIDRLGLGRYAFVAHDSGGAIARLVAADDARVAGLVLSGSEIPGHHARLFEAYVRLARLPGFSSVLRFILANGALRRSPLGFGGCFTDARYVDGDFADWFVRPIVTSAEVADRQLALIRNLDLGLVDTLAAVHARLRAPVRCIWGTRDPFFPLAKAREMLAQFAAGGELVEIAGGKLFVHEDRAAEHVAAALPFLRACFGPARPREE